MSGDGQIDQGLLVRAMAEKGVGVEVASRHRGRRRDGVAAAVRRVMVEDEGKVFRSNAEKVKEAAGISILRTGLLAAADNEHAGSPDDDKDARLPNTGEDEVVREDAGDGEDRLLLFMHI
ncbi:hypothetical protein E2562_018934 [Oryza meyeriana var. granulata]|uniref:Uncharacterized protein n=1 Tax=Oryza meyeriana var. granulata TaxID=110450 RepID=A0A6G1DJN3_9ORYZ|nr:hypothetical protein E2562_018934 [Oryza meyeriana var. granulata]